MRLVGMGEYHLVRAGNHTELACDFIPPQQCNEWVGDLSLGLPQTYIIGVKNPQPTDAAPSLQAHDYRQGFASADPVDLLNQEGAELLLMSTKSADQNRAS
jgi:hypothetical protein